MRPGGPRVVKFGGSTVGSGARLVEAARTVAASRSGLTVVVASAPGDLTDRTLGVLAGGPLRTDGPEAARILIRAEQLGAELMSSALRACGVETRLLLVDDPDWPVMLESGGTDARIDLTSTEERFRRLSSSARRGEVWVLPGFVGIDRGGRPGTLPRGGGDTTAVVAARCLGAREVYLVKDVPGVLETDPRVDPSARPIRELSREQMVERARSGARVVALDALGYLSPELDLRVVGLGAPLDGSSGTLVRSGAPPSGTEASVGPSASASPSGPARVAVREPV